MVDFRHSQEWSFLFRFYFRSELLYTGCWDPGFLNWHLETLVSPYPDVPVLKSCVLYVSLRSKCAPFSLVHYVRDHMVLNLLLMSLLHSQHTIDIREYCICFPVPWSPSHIQSTHHHLLCLSYIQSCRLSSVKGSNAGWFIYEVEFKAGFRPLFKASLL